MRKRSKNAPTDSYFYLARKLAKCMMIFNMNFGLVRIKITNTQNMNNSEMITQNTPNSHVCSSDESESTSINTDESESHVYSIYKSVSKMVIINACSSDESE